MEGAKRGCTESKPLGTWGETVGVVGGIACFIGTTKADDLGDRLLTLSYRMKQAGSRLYLTVRLLMVLSVVLVRRQDDT